MLIYISVLSRTGGMRCDCNNQNNFFPNINGKTDSRPNSDTVCVAVAFSDTAQSQGHIYSSVAGSLMF